MGTTIMGYIGFIGFIGFIISTSLRNIQSGLRVASKGSRLRFL